MSPYQMAKAGNLKQSPNFYDGAVNADCRREVERRRLNRRAIRHGANSSEEEGEANILVTYNPQE